MHFFGQSWVGDQWDRVPRLLRAAIGSGLTIWLGGEAILHFGEQGPAARLLTVLTTVVVLAAIAYTWIFAFGRRYWQRLLVTLLVAACSVLSMLETSASVGDVGAFLAVILCSGLGVVGIPIAVLCAAAFVFRNADPGGLAPTGSMLVTGLLGVASMAVAYVGPMWSRYAWSMRTDAAATAERERLAREMHDVLAHTLSGLSVQLEATRLLAEQRPGDPAVAEAVGNAQRLAREGLLEARRAVSALRGDELAGPGQLERLLHDFQRESGVRCSLHVEGTPVRLRAEAQLALYRTAQEALTNVRKHADATEVDIRLVWTRGGAVLTVEDAGTPKPSPAPGGFGLTGIRERAALLGGSLEAGPTRDGYRVRLQLPA